MATEKKVLGNALAQFVGKALTVVTSFIIVKIVSGFGVEFYGNYVTSYEFLAFFGIVADMGLFAMAVREMSKVKEDRSREFILGNVLSIRLLLVLAVVLAAGLIGQLPANYSPEVKQGIWITSISMALTIIAGTLSSILQTRMKIQYFSGSLVTGKVVLAGLVFAIAQRAELFENVFFAFLWAGVISNVLFLGLVWWFASREIVIRLKFHFDWWKSMLRSSLPYGLALILQTLYLRIDVVLISILLGASATGVYGLSTRILESFLVLGVFFGQAMLPKISAEEEDRHKGGKTLSWGIEILLLVSLPLIIGSLCYSRDIIQLLSSSEFLSLGDFFGSDKVLMLLVPTIGFAYLNQLFTFTLVARDRQMYLMVVNGVALLANAALNIAFLPVYGIKAAALSTIGCEVLAFGLLLREIRRHFLFSFSPLNLGIILLVNGGLGGLYLFTPLRQNLELAILVGALVYGLVFWRFRDHFLRRGSV